jgi:DNA polymerase-3 subunit delta'
VALKDIIGQEAAVAALRTAIARDAIPQAYLFVGPEGVGKSTAAIEFAKAVSCKRRVAPSPPAPLPRAAGEGGEVLPDACDSCVNCTRIAESQHPDITRIAPDGEFTRIWQLWSRPGHPPGALENMSFAPVAAPKKFYLFEKAETLNEESANSILKALEEPPPYVHFVLCATSPTAVLPTILSRCQMVRFRQASTDVITQAVAARKGLPESEARVMAAYSQGSIGRAFRLADAPEIREQRDNLLTLAERIAHSPGIAAFKLAEDLRNAAKPGKAKKGEDDGDGGADRTARGDLGRALDVLSAWHSDLLTVALRGPDAPVVHADRRAALVQAAGRYRTEQLAENVETLFTFRRHLARNANAQLATEVMMLKLVPRKGG